MHHEFNATRKQFVVQMLCGKIIRGKEAFKGMDYVKTNDQQRNGVVPVCFDVRMVGHSAPSFLDTSGIRALAVRAGSLTARKPSMADSASPRAKPH